MAFDNTCKFLAETFTDDITAWLLGQSVALTRLETKELSLEPIRPDTLVLLQSKSLILHIEFQVDPKENIPFRMADYRLRCFRKSGKVWESLPAPPLRTVRDCFQSHGSSLTSSL